MASARNILVIASLALSVLIGLVIARGKTGDGAGNSATSSSGGGGGGGSSGKVVIGLSLDTLKEARWQVDRDYFVAAAKKLGVEVDVQSANSDDSQQMMQITSMLTAGVKALVIVPHDGLAMAKAVELAHQSGVPVISYDRIIQNCDLDLYLSFDNLRVGEAQAKYLVDHLPTPGPGKGKIVRIYGAPTDNNAKLFKQGQDNVLAPYIQRGDIVVVHEDWAEDWKPENAKKIVNAAIATGAKFDGILASNDGTAGGALQALIEAGGLAGKVVVTGQDAELPACQRIVAGTQSMTVYKPIHNLAAAAAQAAVKIATGKPIVANKSIANGKIDVPSILCDVVTVTQDNIMDTVIKDGFQKYDEVYRGVPENQRPAKP